MQLTQTLNEGLKRQFQVTVAAADLAARLDAELDALKGKIRINGFRPGKVPVAHLKRVYGRSVMADVVQNTVTEANRRIVEENQLKLAMEPQIKFSEDKDEIEKAMEARGDLSFDIAVEVLPKIEVQDHTGIAVEKQVVDIEDSEVNAAIERMAASNRAWNDKGAKKAETGDKLSIDFLGTVDGVAFEGGTASDVDLVLGSNSFIPGFEEQLVGLKAGGSKSVEVTFPESYQVAALAGKPAVFAVTVKTVSAPGELVIDDELAKKFGIESLDKLKEAVKKSIGEELDEVSRTKLKRQVLDGLDKLYTFDLPPTLVEQEFTTVWTQVQQDMDARKTNFAAEGSTEDEARAEYRRIAERRVRLGLVLAELGEKAEIKITDDEVTQALIARARQFPGQEKQIWDYYRKNPQALAELRAPIFEEKVIDTLLAAVKVTEKKVSRDQLLANDDAGEAAETKAEKPKKAAKKKAE